MSSSSSDDKQLDPSCLCPLCPPEDGIADEDCATTNTEDGGCNSVVLRTGQFKFTLPLLSVAGIGIAGWDFKLSYLSGSGLEGLLGSEFNYSQFEHLESLEDDDVIDLFTSKNTVERFIRVGSGYSSAGNNTAAVLQRTGTGADDEFKLIRSSGSVTTFYGFDAAVASPGQLKSKADRYGNTLTFEWSSVNGISLLRKVTDGYGRQVTYSYCTPGVGTSSSSSSSSSASGGTRICEIEDFLGRKLSFQYDEQARLVAVVLPSILRAAEGNAFPGGTAYVFRYQSALPDGSSSSSSSSVDPDNLVNIWYPNQVMPYLDTATRTVNVDALYAAANAGSVAARYTILYDGQRRVTSETVGDPGNGVGGSYTFDYSGPDLPRTNLIDAADPIVAETIVTDRNGNEVASFFNAAEMVVCKEVRTNREKITLSTGATPDAYVTWTKYNGQNQVEEKVLPAGNAVLNTYDNGMVDFGSGPELYVRRRGLLQVQTRTPGNTHSINAPTRPGSGPSGEEQEELTRRYFYDPIYNRVCATIEERGNPIDTGLYFTPQNGGATPTNADRSRYTTIRYYDYQQNTLATIKNNPTLQDLLFPGDASAADKIEALIDHVNDQMTATDGTGGIPAGFEVDLGDINGDGTGDGDSSGLPAAAMLGNVVKIQHPDVRLLTENTEGGDPWQWTTQQRVELFTVNNRGQVTTHTDPEGNVTVYVRYPFNDPEGDGQFIAADTSTPGKQYGRQREVHVDVDPNDVMSLVGADGDLADFTTDVYPRDSRTNTPGVYQDLITRYEGGMAAGGCSSCAYDPLGNPLATTDPRGFTTLFQRNEMGEVYRTTSSQPYQYKTEIYYDANRNVIRRDIEDVTVQFDSPDPASAGYAHFTPQIDENAPNVAHVPTLPGAGGEIRPGWFTNLFVFDLLDNMTEQDLDATGSTPSSLVTQYAYDANQNVTLVTKPQGNIVQYDYDERNLRIAEAAGACTFDSASSSSSSSSSASSSSSEPVSSNCSVTIYFYDRNGNLEDVIGAAQRGATGNELTATIEDAFGSGNALVHTGDWLVENTYDGFDRVIAATDAAGNVANSIHDPGSRVIESNRYGPVTGPTPDNRTGSANVKLAESFARFDEAGRAYESQQTVLLADGTTIPSGRTITHTGGGLEANSTTNGHTATADLTDEETSYILSRTVFDAANRAVIAAQDNASLTHMTYDGAGRQITATDALGNLVENTYDGNSNLIHSKRTEKCTITLPGEATIDDETFESAMYYDCLNRLVVTAGQGADGTLSNDPDDETSGGTLFTFTGYDSRGNTVVTIDPKKNTVIAVYDGASRPTESNQHLRKLGEGTNPPEGNQTFLAAGGATIRTITVLDGNSRVKQLIDDRGAPTNYTYDALDRQLTMVFQDGSTRSNFYNAAGDVEHYIDENGSVFDNTFDCLGRLTLRDITPAASVGGTLVQQFGYDGLSRLTGASDEINYAASVGIYYDSLSRSIEERADYGDMFGFTTYSAWNSLVPTEMTFPGTRMITNVYDALYRRTRVEEGSGVSSSSSSSSSSDDQLIASWKFFGSGRVAEVQLGNGLICSYMNNARTHSAVQASVANPAWGNVASDRLGYDGAGRMISKRYLAGGIDPTYGGYNNPSSVVGFTTEFDKSSNKLYERHLHCEPRSHLYQPFINNQPQGGYDSIDRLRQYQRGILASGGGGVATPISLPNAKEQQTYNLDGLGNWRNTTYTPVSGSLTIERRDHNHLNQITATKEDSDPKVLFEYDGTPGASNGNLENDGVRKYVYDAFNRLIEVYKDPNGTPVKIAEYIYDALGRRARKWVMNGGLSGSIPNDLIHFFYTPGGWRVTEEWLIQGSGSYYSRKQYVWGIYLDELIQQKNIPALNNFPANAELYPLQDLLYRTTGLADDAGVVREAYDCDAYGNTLIFRNSGSPPTAIAYDDVDTQVALPTCDFIFTGQRYDAESGVYQFKTRFYVPGWGRFGQRDLLIVTSLYRYCLSSPTRFVDPLGLDTKETFDEYWQRWLASHQGLSDSQKERLKSDLARGCVGIVCLNLGETGTPDQGADCYLTLGEALAKQKQMETDKDCECIIGGYNTMGYQAKPKVFGFKFWRHGNKLPMNKDGSVALDDLGAQYKYFGRGPGYVNYDYGWYVPETGEWIHADHLHDPKGREGPMTVYTDKWNQPYDGFNTTVYCVACEDDEHIAWYENNPQERAEIERRKNNPPPFRHWSQDYHP